MKVDEVPEKGFEPVSWKSWVKGGHLEKCFFFGFFGFDVKTLKINKLAARFWEKEKATVELTDRFPKFCFESDYCRELG